jgi:hypothetical protein
MLAKHILLTYMYQSQGCQIFRGTVIPKCGNIYQKSTILTNGHTYNRSNWHKLHQHFQFRGPPKFTQIGIFGLKPSGNPDQNRWRCRVRTSTVSGFRSARTSRWRLRRTSKISWSWIQTSDASAVGKSCNSSAQKFRKRNAGACPTQKLQRLVYRNFYLQILHTYICSHDFLPIIFDKGFKSDFWRILVKRTKWG